MKLSDTKIKASKPKKKVYKLTDGLGLTLVIHPKGGRYWQLRYRMMKEVHRVEQTLSLGTYPELSLAEARKKRDEARIFIAHGQDPQAEKKKQTLEKQSLVQSFEKIAEQWMESVGATWAVHTYNTTQSSLRQHVYPKIGSLTLDEITTPMVVDVLKTMDHKGLKNITRKVAQRINATMEYGRILGISNNNPCVRVSKVINSYQIQNMPCIEIEYLPRFLKDLDQDKTGYNIGRIALRLLMLTAVRTNELIQATWEEINLGQAEWIIPASRMKSRREHYVPLSKQACLLLKQAQEINTMGTYVFESPQDCRKPISNNYILKILHRLDMKGKMTGHGFRSLFSTVANASGEWRIDVIERQLAHAPVDKVRAAYNRHDYLEERRKLMQWYADHIDEQG